LAGPRASFTDGAVNDILVYRRHGLRMIPGMGDLNLRIDGFLDAVSRRLRSAEAEDVAVAAEAEALRRLWPGRTLASRITDAERLPACDYLDVALDRAVPEGDSDLASSIAALRPALHWTYSYPANPRDRELGSKVAFSQIVGGRGLRPDTNLHIGLTLIAPHVVYPAHFHPAVELYLVVSGHALWQSGTAEPALRPPGSLILHASNVVHAMTTFEEPLLAVWTWRGDLASPSVYVNLHAEAQPA
jgi:quercetin dioxygenase-like cupin family protein